jgi:hypothetical protein
MAEYDGVGTTNEIGLLKRQAEKSTLSALDLAHEFADHLDIKIKKLHITVACRQKKIY